MKTKPQGGPQHTAHCEYNISCAYGRNYVGKLSRQLAIQLQEQRQNLKQGHP
jgi:hypothetical protein